jgi:hypothetical protein
MLGYPAIGAAEIGSPIIATGVPANFDDWLAASDQGTEFLVEIGAFVAEGTTTTGRGGLGDAEIGILEVGGSALQSSVSLTSELRYSRFGWTGDPSDAIRPNIQYAPRLTDGLRSNRRIPILPEQARRADRLTGRIDFLNSDGALDDLRQNPINGQKAKVLFGRPTDAYADYKSLFDGVGTVWSQGRDVLTANVRSRGANLEVPIQTTLYTGTGGASGDATVEGQPKPLIFGKVRNVTATLIDAQNLVYQVHDGEVASIDDVYDRAASLTFDSSAGDVADYQALVNATISAGEYAISTATGLFRLGSSPDGQITADVTGLNTAIDNIVLDIVRNYAVEMESRISTASVTGFGTLRSGTVGTFIGSNERATIADVLDQLVAGLAGIPGYNRRGQFVIQRLRDPSTLPASLSLGHSDILSLRPRDTLVPRWRQRVAYKRNWTTQQSDIAGAVSDDRRQFVQNRFSTVAASDTSVRDGWPNANDPDPLMSPFDSSSDAQTLADDLLALHGVGRELVDITVGRLGFTVNSGQIVSIPWPRWDSNNSKRFAIVGIEERPREGTITLTGWG